jgi:hypothetical protein
MRAGGRSDTTIALSPGRCNPFCRCLPAILVGHSRPGRASCRLSHVRIAPLVTLGHRSATCRDGQERTSARVTRSLRRRGQISRRRTQRSNPHSARCNIGARPAISCLGAFRTPAASARGWSRHPGVRKPAHNLPPGRFDCGRFWVTLSPQARGWRGRALGRVSKVDHTAAESRFCADFGFGHFSRDPHGWRYQHSTHSA